jgi:hypothetical protein
MPLDACSSEVAEHFSFASSPLLDPVKLLRAELVTKRMAGLTKSFSHSAKRYGNESVL